MFQEVKSLFGKELSELNRRCTIKVAPPGLHLEGDENMLKQVMINLVRNSMDALKNSSDGTVNLIAKKEGTYINLVVEDNGPGMPEEVKENAFLFFAFQHG